jgi:hypothetical protein
MFTNFILEILTSFFEIEIFPTLQNRDANVTQFTYLQNIIWFSDDPPIFVVKNEASMNSNYHK